MIMILKNIFVFIKKSVTMNDEVKKIYNKITENKKINLYRDKGISHCWNNEKNCLILNWEHFTFRANSLKIYFLCGKYHIIFYKDNDKMREFKNLELNEISKTINDFLVIKLI